MPIKHSSHARHEIWYHFAWATKYRKKVFNNDKTKNYLKNLFRKIASEYDMEIGTIEVLSDHVHFTLCAPPKIAPMRAAQIIKSISTKIIFNNHLWLKQYYWGGELWVRGYFVRTIGPGLTKEQIEEYIKEQSEEI